MATPGGHPGRTLIILGVIVVALFGLMALSKSWSPKLGLDLQGGTTITLTASNTTGSGAVDATSLQLAQTIIQSRVDSLGVGESEVTISGNNQLVVSVPNVQQDQLVALVGQTAVLRFRAVIASEAASGASTGPVLPTKPPTASGRPTEPGKGLTPDKALTFEPTAEQTSALTTYTCDSSRVEFPDVSDQPLYACNEAKTQKFLLGPTLIQGDQVTNASAGIPQNRLDWVVNLEFNSAGGTAFEKATGALAQKTEPQNQFGIVLDGKVISNASVSQAIAGGRAEISGGSFTQQSATQLANVLKYGALPLAFEVSEVSNVSATLGGEQLHAGIVAGIIGLILVVGFCFLYYRGLGIVVVSSLVVAALITYAAMVLLGSSVGFALNLPGIAGAIVAIGVTADSFVIYFERIRDEVRDGRSLRTAVETGWRRARQTVLIADAVSMLSAIILFILAIGSVKGFAFTLGLTTVIDVAVVFFFTKPLMTLLSRTRFFGGGHRLSGLDPAHLGVTALPGSRTRRLSGRPATQGEGA